MTTDTQILNEFEQNKKKAEALATRKNKLEIEIAAAKRQQSVLEEEADLLFGTHDLIELTDLLEKLRADNQHKLTLFASNIQSADAELTAIEQNLAALIKSVK